MKQPRAHVWVANRRRFGPSSERKLSKYYGGYGFVEPQVPERGVEDRYLLDDFCMGIELTVIVCWHAGRPTLHQSTISG